MKARDFLFLMVLPAFIGSCCTDDKQCPAGDPALFSAVPYRPGQILTYSDDAQNRIVIRLDPSYNCSEASVIEGSCKAMKKYVMCNSQVSLSAEVVSDSANLLTSKEKFFSVAVSQTDDGAGQIYNLSAFNQANVSMYSYPTREPENCTTVASYATPYKTYTKVFRNKTTNSITIGPRKYIADASGRLLSFSLHNDTTHIFYLVE